MDNRRTFLIQLVRHLIQAAAFLLAPGLFILIFSSVRDIVTACLGGAFAPAELMAQIALVAAVFLVTALFGRFFCGYLCSFGAFQELLYFIGGRRSRRKQVAQQTDGVLKCFKYIVLALIVAFVWVLQLPVDSSWSPWDVFGLLVSGNFSAIPDAIPTAGFVLLAASAAGSLFVEHFFCRYLCPLGAMFAATSRLQLCQVRRNVKTCTDCGLCTRVCGMGVDVPATDTVTSGECIQCMRCLPACPQHSLTVSPSGAVAGVAAAAAISGAAVFGSALTSVISTAYAAPPAQVESEEHGLYTDGIYTGTGQGFRGTTEVQVTVEGGRITDITVVSSGDDRLFLQQAQAGVIPEVLHTQSADVSAVSGATYSSRGIMDAVASALGTEIPAAAAAAPAAVTPAQPPAHARDGTAAEASPADSSHPSAATETSPAEGDQSSAAETGSFTAADGVYEGTGTGFRGTTRVAVTVEGGQITDITVVSYSDDRQYFTRAQDSVISSIIQSQSVNVQTVSGATFSSNGIMEAVADALEVEFNAGVSSSRGGARGHARGRSSS